MKRKLTEEEKAYLADFFRGAPCRMAGKEYAAGEYDVISPEFFEGLELEDDSELEDTLELEDTSEFEAYDHDYPSVHDNPYYNEALDMDQQSEDFWEEL